MMSSRTQLSWVVVDQAHRALLAEIRHRLEAVRDDPKVVNTGGSNYWGPYVTRAVSVREHDGPALVQYVKGVLRKSGESQGWNALLEADRLNLSFEDMVLSADEPIRGLFDDEDREIAEQLLGVQGAEISRRRDAAEAVATAYDQRIVGDVAARRRAAGKPWTAEIEAQMLADRAERRNAAH